MLWQIQATQQTYNIYNTHNHFQCADNSLVCLRVCWSEIYDICAYCYSNIIRKMYIILYVGFPPVKCIGYIRF